MSKQRSVPEWFEEGLRCFHEGDGVGAVQALEAVIEQDPAYRHTDGDNPYFYLGKIHEIEGRLDVAVIFYTRALAVDCWDEESLIGRGSCLTVQRRHDEAVADFKKALSIPKHLRNVADEHLMYSISENYRQLNDASEALEWGQRAIAANPRNARIKELVHALQAQLSRRQDR